MINKLFSNKKKRKCHILKQNFIETKNYNKKGYIDYKNKTNILYYIKIINIFKAVFYF